jgi:hypothetical protein
MDLSPGREISPVTAEAGEIDCCKGIAYQEAVGIG